MNAAWSSRQCKQGACLLVTRLLVTCLLVTCLLVTCSLMSACSKASPAPAETDPAAPTGAASAASRWVIARKPLDWSLFEVPAVVRAAPDATLALTAPVRARVASVEVKAGDRVAAGQPIARLYLPELLEAAAVAQASSDRLVAHRKWLGELKSLKSEGLVRSADVFEAEAKVAELHADLTRAQAQLRAAGMDPSDGATLLRGGKWTLIAPQAGVITSVLVEPGAGVEAGVVLARIVSERAGRVEARLNRPLPNDATLQFVSAAGQIIDLATPATATAVDPADGALLVWYEPRQPIALPNGLRGRVRVAAVPGQAVEVPVRALIRRDGRAQVLLQPAKPGDDPPHHDVEVLAIAGPLAIVRGLDVGAVVAAEADLASPESSDFVAPPDAASPTNPAMKAP